MGLIAIDGGRSSSLTDNERSRHHTDSLFVWFTVQAYPTEVVFDQNHTVKSAMPGQSIAECTDGGYLITRILRPFGEERRADISASRSVEKECSLPRTLGDFP
jgi:hypothetical protein